MSKKIVGNGIAQVADSQSAVSQDEILPSADSKPKQRTVLVVEDFEDNRFMMRRLLEMNGYRVVEAENGEEAVGKAEAEIPDLILMDLSLPILDGLAATRRIRQLPDFGKVPVVAVSAHDTADFHAEALAAGCNEYVTKPIDFDELESLLQRLLIAR
ncbi:MAG: response regulator [Pyrinomonadaceae bacterium MAG19_C2-C3]|nr:response regulator [Pyrinomonadaceae bacterium MAG19_C2-C3]